MKLFVILISFIAFSNAVSDNTTNEDSVGIRIFNGEEPANGQYPFVGFLSGYDWNSKLKHCAGTIIHGLWVLTAGRCIEGNPSYFISGTTHTADYHGERYDIEGMYRQKKYYYREVDVYGDTEIMVDNYDVALVKLDRPINFRDVNDTQAIKLENDPKADYTNQIGIFMGWGRTTRGDLNPRPSPVLQYAKARILTIKECRAESDYRHVKYDLHICTSAENRVAACPGDLGGPLVIGHKQIGVLNFGDCGKGKPSIFSKVSASIEWIKSTMKSEGNFIPVE